MKYPRLLALLALALCSCSTYQPLGDKALYPSPRRAAAGPGVKVTYFGNTTILISDGRTKLLVDGFFSRPALVDTVFGKVTPDESVIEKQLALGKIGKVDALLIGHTHFDHALDAPTVAEKTGAAVMGSKSYGYVHEGRDGKMDRRHLVIVPRDGMTRHFGNFKVTFRFSKHIPPHLPKQDQMEGQITKKVPRSALATDYKCDDVFVIHIEHPQGSLAITTTAGAKPGQFDGLRADVVMLAVGLLVKEPCERQEIYWHETVGKLCPHTVIPVHWDDFSRKLDDHDVVQDNLAAPSLKRIDDSRKAMDFVKRKAGGRAVWVMGLRDSFLLRGGKIRLASPDK